MTAGANTGEGQGRLVHVVSLGCARNLVDSELLLGALARAGFVYTHDPADAEIIVVNTCGFIRTAMDESIDTILELSDCKDSGRCRILAVTGCLPQRFGTEIVSALPEVDVFLGTGAMDQAVRVLAATVEGPVCVIPDPSLSALQPGCAPRMRSTPHMAYVKIQEGCKERCTYCIIPKLRGRARSRPVADIAEETGLLVNGGAREIVLVAQDTTAYGADFEDRESLATLLARLAPEVRGRARIRFLYGHPDHVDDELLETVAAHADCVCPYFDIPVQHASDRILKLMGRPNSRDKLAGLFVRIRDKVPGAVLRTTLLVGFPGETEKDFLELAGFMEEVGFDHAGVFVYSDAEDLPSHWLPGHVPGDVAEARRDRLMEMQAGISALGNEARIGSEAEVLVTGPSDEPGFQWTGRTRGQAPDVDGVCHVAGNVRPGDIVKVRITGAGVYDLLAEVP
ncbi:MAG: 30S ribosomal protein S12 methylthiotransferase RimO [Desulfatibacillaceae bacterium]